MMFRLCVLFALLSILPVQAQVNFTSSNFPIIVINTSGKTIVDEPKITAQMGIIDNGKGVRNNMTDPFNNFNGSIGIEIRGSSSQMFPKKQYGIELRNEAGEGIDASLLGLPKKDDWVLFAPYNDKSLMRDVLAYKLARDQKRYASRSRYCELVLNGEYQGVYVLLEKVKRDKNRIDIAKLDPNEISGEDLTGGYIVKIDKMDVGGGAGWNSSYTPPGRSKDQRVYFQYEYPKEEDIATEQKNYIKAYMDAFETSLYGDDFKTLDKGYAHYIDVPSFVDYFLINELTRNPDAYRISTFMYKQKDSDGGKLFMGPAWDFNLGFGNVDFCMKEKPEGFVINYNAICPEDGWLVPFWWSRLFQDEVFSAKVNVRWRELRNGPYATNKILSYVDSTAAVLNSESQQRNFQRWPVLGQYVWPNAFVGQTFQQEIDWMKTWITARLNWMDANLPLVITDLEKDSRPINFSVKTFPNPVHQNLELEYSIDRGGAVIISVFDLMGRKVNTIEKYQNEPGSFTEVLPFHNLATGNYIVHSQFGSAVVVKKVMKR